MPWSDPVQPWSAVAMSGSAMICSGSAMVCHGLAPQPEHDRCGPASCCDGGPEVEGEGGGVR